MDTIGEFLTRIRNASLAKHDKVDVPSSNVRVGIANVLKNSGYIRNFKVVKDDKQGIMRIYLSYKDDGKAAITDIRRASRPGRRLYVTCEKIPNVRSGYGMAVISTSGGMMSSKEATAKGLGGELVCTLY